MADGRLLSEGDYKRLQAMLTREKQRIGNIRRGSDPLSESDFFPPEVYVARVPAGGIPETDAGTGSDVTVSSVECAIYQLVGDELQPTNFTQYVRNPFAGTVPSGLTLVLRDKFGDWYAIAGGGDGIPADLDDPAGGGCELARLKTTDCIKVTGPTNTVWLRWAGSQWISNAEFQYLDVMDGVVTARYNSTTRKMDVEVDGLGLYDCGNGCFTGGPLTGHIRSGTDFTAECEGEVFSACIECTCCPIDGWHGPGIYCVNVLTAGTGTGTTNADCEVLTLDEEDACDTDLRICSGPYATQAEADAVCSTATTITTCAEVPTNPTAVISGATGVFACLNGLSIPLTYQPSVFPGATSPGLDGWWGSLANSCPPLCNYVSIFMACHASDPTKMQFGYGGHAAAPGPDGDPTNYDTVSVVFSTGPFSVTHTYSYGLAGFCGGVGAGNMTITIA